MKNLIKRIFGLFDYKLSKSKSIDPIDLNSLTKSLITKSEPVIFDVGANNGQSIIRYKKLYQSSIIHSFEPNVDEFNILKKKYDNHKDLYLNNVAVGDEKGNLEFNINALSGNSSFKNLVPNTTWIKKRSSQINIDEKNYTTKKNKF